MVLHDLAGQLAERLQEQRADQLRAIRHAELAVHAHQVGLDRRLPEREIARDFLVRATVAHEPRDLLLAVGQPFLATDPVDPAPGAQQRAQRGFGDRLQPRECVDLAASVWSNDLKRVMNLVPQIEAGTVWVNCHIPLDPSMPFGGYKQSGIGREFGQYAIEGFTETKSVCIAH